MTQLEKPEPCTHLGDLRQSLSEGDHRARFRHWLHSCPPSVHALRRYQLRSRRRRPRSRPLRCEQPCPTHPRLQRSGRLLARCHPQKLLPRSSLRTTVHSRLQPRRSAPQCLHLHQRRLHPSQYCQRRPSGTTRTPRPTQRLHSIGPASRAACEHSNRAARVPLPPRAELGSARRTDGYSTSSRCFFPTYSGSGNARAFPSCNLERIASPPEPASRHDPG